MVLDAPDWLNVELELSAEEDVVVLIVVTDDVTTNNIVDTAEVTWLEPVVLEPTVEVLMVMTVDDEVGVVELLGKALEVDVVEDVMACAVVMLELLIGALVVEGDTEDGADGDVEASIVETDDELPAFVVATDEVVAAPEGVLLSIEFPEELVDTEKVDPVLVESGSEDVVLVLVSIEDEEVRDPDVLLLDMAAEVGLLI